MRNLELDKLSDKKLAEIAAECLSRLEPGRQPLGLFTQMARHMVTSTVELALFNDSSEEPEVMLSRRDPDDLWWPNKIHVPGVIVMPAEVNGLDSGYDQPVDRLIDEEFSKSISRTGSIEVFDIHLRSGARGSEQTAFCLTEAGLNEGYSSPINGQFFNLEQVKELEHEGILIEGHKDTLEKAFLAYQ